MITARLCNPADGQQFRHFIHNTTTYVGVPHEAECRLWLTTPDQPGYLSIEAENKLVVADQRIETGGFVQISDLHQPLKPARGLGGFIPPFLRFGSKRPKKEPLRLYAFRVIYTAKPRDSMPLATFDFHLLCLEDYNWARTFEARLQMDPAAIAPATIGDVAEGTCVRCAEVREQVRRDWLQED